MNFEQGAAEVFPRRMLAYSFTSLMSTFDGFTNVGRVIITED